MNAVSARLSLSFRWGGTTPTCLAFSSALARWQPHSRKGVLL
jgi:hypothetical protein